MFINQEELAIGPDVGTVVGNVNRKVSDDADVALASVRSQCLPLAEELVLKEFLGLNRGRQ